MELQVPKLWIKEVWILTEIPGAPTGPWRPGGPGGPWNNKQIRNLHIKASKASVKLNNQKTMADQDKQWLTKVNSG